MLNTPTLPITVGNTAKEVGDERWQWKLFVDAPPEYDAGIRRVVIHLHETFRPKTQELRKTADGTTWESTAFTGWGTFAIGIDLHTDQRVVRLEHDLVFRGGGARSTVQVPLTDEDTTPGNRLDRKDVLKQLSSKPFLNHDDALFWHGRAYSGPLQAPTATWESDLRPRDDHHTSCDWLTASEFCDSESVLNAKVEQLAQLIRFSQNTVIYTGAGISRAAGIGQAARSGGALAGARKVLPNLTTTAQPTFTHYAVAALADHNYIKGGWVQQNHDGLPQKAGFPQEAINEIHGSWYDPSNPVVLYSGSLKSEQHDWMLSQTRNADLVLVMGTSLGGLSADQVCLEAAKRSLKARSLGMVMINLQQTEQDGKASLRIFGETDRVTSLLLEKLGIPKPCCQPIRFGQETRILVPYDARGRRSKTTRMWLDLRRGAAIKLTDGHNIRGAGQPAHKCIRRGHGKVVRWCSRTSAIHIGIEGASMSLGQWWLSAAARGGPETLPVVNVHPEIEQA